jgi:hypothetical protein
MIRTQGHNANRTGRAAEHIIAATLDQRGYQPQRQHLIGTSIFDTALYADFYLSSAPGFPNGLAIESKWQQVGGSAEEKLCYLVENIRHVYPCPVIIVIDGGGFRPGAARWVRAQVGQGNLYAVFAIAEFLTWLNNTL